MTIKLELILNKGTSYEFMFDLGQLTEKIKAYGMTSTQTTDQKHMMMAKYDIGKKSIKANYFTYQHWVVQMHENENVAGNRIRDRRD